MQKPVDQLILVGGSAGSLPVMMTIIESLPPDFTIPVVIILHRLKNVNSEMDKILTGIQKHLKIREPEDKEPIRWRHIYLAPQNYHLLMEQEKIFSLDYSEPVHFSRPAIDVTFESAVSVFGSGLTAVLLSGANQDGTAGLIAIQEAGGTVIVQEPATCEYPTMTQSAIDKISDALVLPPVQIALFLKNLSSRK